MGYVQVLARMQMYALVHAYKHYHMQYLFVSMGYLLFPLLFYLLLQKRLGGMYSQVGRLHHK